MTRLLTMQTQVSELDDLCTELVKAADQEFKTMNVEELAVQILGLYNACQSVAHATVRLLEGKD